MPVFALIFLVAAMLCELGAALWWLAPDPYRGRLIAAGLFCYFVMELIVRTGIAR